MIKIKESWKEGERTQITSRMEERFISNTSPQRKLEGLIVSLVNSFKCLRGGKTILYILYSKTEEEGTLCSSFYEWATPNYQTAHLFCTRKMEVWLKISKSVIHFTTLTELRIKLYDFFIDVEKIFDKFKYS